MKKQTKQYIVIFLISSSFIFSSIASASLTFNGTSVAGDSNSTFDAAGILSIGTTSATSLTIGNASAVSTFPGPAIFSANVFLGGALNVTSTLTVNGAATLKSSLTQSGGVVSLGATTINGNATTTNLSVTSLAGASGCLSVSASGAITTSTCGGGVGVSTTTINGLTSASFTFNGTANQITIASSAPNVITASLPQNIATNSSPTFGSLFLTGNATTTNLSITGLAGQSGCLSVSASGAITTSTCSGGSGGSLSSSSVISANNFPFWANATGGLSGTSTLTVNGTSLTQSNNFFVGGNLNTTGSAVFASSLTQSGGAVSLGATAINGNATTTNLSITGLAGQGGCLSVSGTGAVTTSTCTGGSLSGGQNNFIPLWTGTNTLGTSTLQAAANSLVTTGGLALGTTTNQAAGNLFLTGNATTTNLSIAGLAGQGGCLSVSASGAVTTSTCSGGSLSGGQNNFIPLWTGAGSLATSTLQATAHALVTTGGFAIGTTTDQTAGNLFLTGNATTTNLSITGLAGQSGCLSVSASGAVTTSTCSGGLSNLSQNADGSDNGAKAITSAAPTASASSCDWSQSNSCTITASGGNVTVTFSNPHGSGPYILGLCNDSSARTWTLPGSLINGVSPVVASACTYQTLQYDGSSNYQGLAAVSTEQPSILRGTERSAPATSASGKAECWWDSTNHVFTCNENASGSNTVMVVTSTAVANTFVTGLSAAGVLSTQAISATSPITLSGGGAIGFSAAPSLGTTTVTALTVNGQATTTNLSITGLAGQGGCLSVSASGVVATSTCSGAGLSGGQNNFIPLWTGANSLGTSTLQAATNALVTTGGFAVGTTTNQAAGNLFVTGNATTTNLSISSLAGASGCLSVSASGAVTTSACSGGSLSGGQNNFIPLWTGAGSLATSTLQATAHALVTTGGFAVGTTTDQAAGNLFVTGQSTTTNLSITGLAGQGGCLSVSASGAVATSTCSGGSGVSSISGDGTLISNSGSTGATTLTLGSAGAHKFWMNNTGGSATPAYQSPTTLDLSSFLVPTPAAYTNDWICNVGSTINGYACTTNVGVTETYFQNSIVTFAGSSTATSIDGGVGHAGFSFTTLFDLTDVASGLETLQLNACSSFTPPSPNTAGGTCNNRVALWKTTNTNAGAQTNISIELDCKVVVSGTATTLITGCANRLFPPNASYSAKEGSIPNTGANWVLVWSVTYPAGPNNKAFVQLANTDERFIP